MSHAPVVGIAGKVKDAIGINQDAVKEKLRKLGLTLTDKSDEVTLFAVDEGTMKDNPGKFVKEVLQRDVPVVSLEWIKDVLSEAKFFHPQNKYFLKEGGPDSAYQSRESTPEHNSDGDGTSSGSGTLTGSTQGTDNSTPRDVSPAVDDTVPLDLLQVETSELKKQLEAFEEAKAKLGGHQQAIKAAEEELKKAEAEPKPPAEIEQLKEALRQRESEANVSQQNAKILWDSYQAATIAAAGSAPGTRQQTPFSHLLSDPEDVEPRTEALDEIEFTNKDGVKMKGKILGLVDYYILVTTDGFMKGRRQLHVIKKSDHQAQADAYYREHGGTMARQGARYYKDKGFEPETLNIMCVGQGSNRTYIFAAPENKPVLFGITDMKTTWSSSKVERVLNEIRASVRQEPLEKRKKTTNTNLQVVAQPNEALEKHLPC